MENVACTLLAETILSAIGKYLIWNETAVIVFSSVFLFPLQFSFCFSLLFLCLYFLSLSTSIPWFICFSLVPLNCLSFCYTIFFSYFWVVFFFRSVSLSLV
jgi:hypothetical protein